MAQLGYNVTIAQLASMMNTSALLKKELSILLSLATISTSRFEHTQAV